ncbi:non-ribosomal peptide synthetase [Streptomyces hoynatensis]|uniref:Non-ribosomal peptide synthetase n=2 Tax=Streptomyces hoynatensis TaxID=1141874 RepID=A0A3A9ZC27_9ACTN|nr:non-ribosomal peptide synthetase [Streptomyces hoynatensis]
MAAARPGKPALVHGPRTTTYGELDATADSWAARLAEAGAGPGSLVPILLPRGPRLVTALLAVLKTGAAYSLLDPDWPPIRLAEVCARLRAPLLVSDAPPAGPGLPAWAPPREPLPPPPGFRPAAVRGADPCTVFFTSGTTGTPKGVVSPHRATARLFRPGGFARFGADTVTALAAPVPWDAFSFELWSALLNGGTCVIVAEPYLSPAALRTAVTRHGTTTVWLTSSLFNMVVDEDPDAFTGLRQVLTGGERLSAPHVRRFLARHPGLTLLNGYGPVESTVFATTHRITAADCDRPSGIPLGRPVPGTEVCVARGDRVCAPGETGEICIAGEGLALRYLGAGALTERRFRTLRLGGRETRVYRSGDLGFLDADGLLHYLGRADRQLKVRGHRIEPAEVERGVERALPAVKYCRVLGRTDDSGTVRDLVAFCVPAQPGDPLEGAAAALHAALPAYQRPAAVVSVAGFPTTARGKLDERALLALVPGPPPAAGPPAGEPPAGGPRGADPVLRAVSGVFRSVLGREQVPLDVPFTALGGTSLDAGRVCARLTRALARPVPLSLLAAHPTAAGLAGRLRAAQPPPRPEATAGGAVPLTPLQVVYLTRHLALPGDRTSHCLLTWVVEGELDRAALRGAVRAVHRRHEALHSVYVPDPRPSALPADVPAPSLEVLPAAAGTDAAIRALRDRLRGELDPLGGEVWRTALVPVAGSRVAVFGCVVHHIAFDGWSEAVLAGDLAAAYNAAREGRKPPGPLPPSLAELHAARAGAGPAAGQLDELVRELTGVPPLAWPAGPGGQDPGGHGSGGDGAPGGREPGARERFSVSFPPGVLPGVDALAARAGVTRFAVLLSQWAASLAETTGQRDFAVGVPVAQRWAQGAERMVGCHLTVVCLRLRGAALGGDAAAVAETGRLVRRALAAQDVSFAEVLASLAPPGNHRPPVYQTLFALQDNASPRLELAGARSRFVRQPYLELPLELHSEFWPGPGGGLRLEVSFRTGAVPPGAAGELTRRLTERLHASARAEAA